MVVHDLIIDDEADNPRELACTPREGALLPGRRRLTGETRVSPPDRRDERQARLAPTPEFPLT